MKRNVILSIVLGLFLVAGLHAQDQGARPNMQQRGQQQMDALKKELALTKEQLPKFDAIYKETNDKITKLRESAGDDRAGMREKMTEINKDRDLKITKILTADQVKKFTAYNEKLAAERAARGAGGGGRAGGGGGGR